MLTPASTPGSAEKRSSNRGVHEPIAPHRSVRRLPVTPLGALSTLAIVVLAEAAVAVFAQRGLDAMNAFARGVAEGLGIRTAAVPERLGFLYPAPLSFELRTTPPGMTLGIAIACVAIVAGLAIARTPTLPVRAFAIFNAALVALNAVVQLCGGHGYDSAGFSRLMLQTALCSWAALPLLAGLLAAVFPFNSLQRALFVAAAVGYAVPLAIVGYGLFVAIAAAAGPLVFSNLFLMCGPVLDALPAVCLFSFFLARFDHVLNSGRHRIAWR